MNSHLHIRSSPFEPEVLRSALPPFDFAVPMPRDALFQAYRAYYHLNFEQRWPDLRVRAGQVRAGGFDIAVQTFQPARAKGTVFVLHGYYDHVGIYDHLIEALLERNFAVLTCDLPGHGLSSGERGVIHSFRQYQVTLERMVMLARQHLPRPWHLLGQSTGAAIAADYLLVHSSALDRVPFRSAVFLAPLVRPANWWINSAKHALASRFVDKVDRKFVASSSDPDFVRFVWNEDPLQTYHLSAHWVGALKQWLPFIERHEPVAFPVLLVQGDQDQTVDWPHNIRVMQKLFPRAKLQMIPGMRHHVVNEVEGVRARAFARMREFLYLSR